MKKITFTLLLLCLFSFAIKAQTNQNVDSKTTNQTEVAQMNDLQVTQNNVSESNPISNDNAITANDFQAPKSNGLDNNNAFDGKKSRGQRPVWQYIVIGAVAVIVVALLIIAPNGVNSRTGVI